MPINKRCRHKSPQVGEAGFTLIEMIIVIVLASILGIFISRFLPNVRLHKLPCRRGKERDDDAILVLEKDKQRGKSWQIPFLIMQYYSVVFERE